MTDFFEKFLVSFVPLFVAIDAIGVVGIYISLTQNTSATFRSKLLNEATLTALGVSIVFLFFGKLIFKLLGISVNDFRIAGGLILLILAIMDILFSHLDQRRDPGEGNLGVVPIGIPLIMGPAALTTILISSESVGWKITLAALLLNLFIAWAVFRYAFGIVRLIGSSGTKAVAKVMALFLAAIAVMMIRSGVTGLIHGG
jgi:multiple antibiotic resistance protein